MVITQPISETLLFGKDWDLFVSIWLIIDWWPTVTSRIYFVQQERSKKKLSSFFFLHWNCINIQISYYWKVFLFQRGHITRKYSFIKNCLYIFSVWLTNNFHSKPIFIRIWSFKYINLLVIILSTLSLLKITRFSHQIFSQKKLHHRCLAWF